MSRSVLTPAHHKQMRDLREWARKQGGSVSGLSTKDREQLQEQQAEAQTAGNQDTSSDAAPDSPNNGESVPQSGQ